MNGNKSTVLDRHIHTHSIFCGVLREAVSAFPDDAHMLVLEYLESLGIPERSKIHFRQAWGKVVLANEAFGRGKTKNLAVSSNRMELFCEELLNELTCIDTGALKVQQAKEACLRLDGADGSHRDRSLHDLVASLDSLNSLHSSLASSLRDIYEASNCKNKSRSHTASLGASRPTLAESVGQFRKSLRGTRLAWRYKGNDMDLLSSTQGTELKSGSNSYKPLDASTHGLPSLTVGEVDMQLRTERHDLNEFMSTSEIVGVVVSQKQPVHQERAWTAYLSLHQLTASNHLNIFPLPVGVSCDAATLGVSFAFERTSTQLLASLYSPALSTFLRRSPIVVHRWCAQLSAAADALMSCSGSLMKPVNSAHDVFVRDNGMLLIGNVAFDTVSPRQKPFYRREFFRTAFDLLSRALNTSRIEYVTLHRLEDVMTRGTLASIDDNDEDAMYKAEAAPEVSTEKFSPVEQVLAVVVGSHITLRFVGHHCTAVDIIDINDREDDSLNILHGDVIPLSQQRHKRRHGKSGEHQLSSTSATISLLQVEVQAHGHRSVNAIAQFEAINATSEALGNVSHSMGKNTAEVRITAIRDGILTIRPIAPVAAAEKSFGAVVQSTAQAGHYEIHTCTVRLVLVPRYPVESVLLQDLIGHLEECANQGDSNILEHSALFQKPRNVNSISAGCGIEASVVDVQKGWQDVMRSLNTYGTVNLTNYNNLRNLEHRPVKSNKSQLIR